MKTTPQQSKFLDSMGYAVNPILDACESIAYGIVGIVLLCLVYSALQGAGIAAKDHAARQRCQDIAAFYGVAPESPASHRMLPAGVTIVAKEGRCWRSDDMTEVTGNEH
jgi:hypothetical protein